MSPRSNNMAGRRSHARPSKSINMASRKSVFKQKSGKKTESHVPTIQTIPGDLVCEVLARVAASSYIDMFNAKLSCKIFNDFEDETYIYQQVSFNESCLSAWSPRSKEKDAFLKKCLDAGNAQLLYREAIVDCFANLQVKSALEYLGKAARLGHTGALYVMAIIMLFSGDNEFKQEGIKLLCGMKKSESLRRKLKSVRHHFKQILRETWINNPMLDQRPICCTVQHGHRYGSYWPDFDEEETIRCEACSVDYEVRAMMCS